MIVLTSFSFSLRHKTLRLGQQPPDFFMTFEYFIEVSFCTYICEGMCQCSLCQFLVLFAFKGDCFNEMKLYLRGMNLGEDKMGLYLIGRASLVLPYMAEFPLLLEVTENLIIE